MSYVTSDPEGTTYLRTLPNTTLSCDLGDDGPRYVFIHGLGMGVQDLTPLAKTFLEAGHSIELVLLKGHGGGEAEYFAAHYDEWLAQIDAVCAPHIEHGRGVILVGYSLGSTLALDYATNHPVRGIVAISTFLATLRIFAPHVVLPLAARFGLKKIARFPLTTKIQTHKKLSYHRHLPLCQLRETIQRSRKLRHRAADISCPVLFIHSTFDPLASLSKVQRYAQAHVKKGAILLVHELSHFLQFDVPATFLRDAGQTCMDEAPDMGHIDKGSAYEHAAHQVLTHIKPDCVAHVSLRDLEDTAARMREQRL